MESLDTADRLVVTFALVFLLKRTTFNYKLSYLRERAPGLSQLILDSYYWDYYLVRKANTGLGGWQPLKSEAP